MEFFWATFSLILFVPNATHRKKKTSPEGNCSGKLMEMERIKRLNNFIVFRVMIVVIALHNLSLRSSGLGCHGHFHFSIHIANFIDKNWDKFFPNELRRKRKNLLGTIAGVLSHHSPETFTSGTEIVNSIGWWKLSKCWTPKEYEKFHLNRVKRNVTDNAEIGSVETKRVKLHDDDFKLLDERDIKLENCFLDTEDDLVNELSQLKAELSASCSVKVEDDTPRHGDEIELNSLEKTPSLELINQQDEEEMLQKLKSIIETQDALTTDVPSWIRRYYRQLSIRKLKRAKLQSMNIKTDQVPTLLDRYLSTVHHKKESLLAGSATHDLFQSPFSNQVLHPYIYRDKKIFPRWLKLMCELKHAVNGEVPERSTIDFCYAKPQHIPAVNSLLQKTFWPGIDMSECLSYPDFTVIALYRKLIVGCAFLVPDACHNEAYVSFLAVRDGWDRSGIASFMLYHLTQTSHGKDITLHVSASNPAICLYQKFGFKTEELVLGFYEKYLPMNSPHSPHALLLRLTR